MSSEEHLKKIQDALDLQPKERFIALKQIGFAALEEFKSLKDPTVHDLKNYKEIFSIVRKVPAISPNFQIALTKITTKFLQLLGCDNPQTLIKKSTTIELNSGTIAIGDPFYSSDSPNDIEFINNGKAYFFNTGSDGTFNLQCRVVDAPEPVLTAKEYKNVVAASDTLILNCPSGKIALDDGAISKDQNQIEVAVTPGNYKCQVYIFKFPKGDYSYYTVFSKCENDAINNEREILTLEPDF